MNKVLLYKREKDNNYENGICLNMIIKNESKNMPRLFENIHKFIKYFIICDTGSTDNTVKVIEEIAEKYNIDGEVYTEPFKNFGYNRSYSYNLTKESIVNFKYVLFLDADMVLVNFENINIKNYDKDIYFLQQKTGSLEYFNMRMVKKGTNIECKSPTHEYYDIKGDYKIEYTKDFWINDIGDGGCKEDKYERDIKLLKKGLEEEPNNGRYYFYLAQSYKDTQQFELAILNYKKRIEVGGWFEEVWFSYYMVSFCYLMLKDEDNSIVYCLKGYEFYPKRAECIFLIAKYLCDNKKYNLSKIFVELGEKIPLPDDKLFVGRDVYEYQFQFIKSIISFYLDDFKNGLVSCNNLLMKNNINGNIIQLTLSNLYFYLDKTKVNFEKNKIEYPIEVNSNEWNCMNPSIIRYNDNYLLNLRVVNYKIINSCYYHKKDNSNFCIEYPVSTRNVLIYLDKNLGVLKTNEIIFDDKKYKHIATNIIGYEDMRIFTQNNNLYFMATCRNFTNNNKIVFGNIDNQGVVSKLKVLYGIDDNLCQKNWVPIISKENTTDIHIVYSYKPFIVLKLDLNEFDKNYELNQTINIYKKYDIIENIDFRGSTQFIKINMNIINKDTVINIDGYIALIHEVLFNDGRIYLHRFIIIDDFYKPIYASYPFYLFDKCIQYTCGLTLSNDTFIVSAAIKDEEAYLIKIPINYLNNNIFKLNIKY